MRSNQLQNQPFIFFWQRRRTVAATIPILGAGAKLALVMLPFFVFGATRVTRNRLWRYPWYPYPPSPLPVLSVPAFGATRGTRARLRR